MARQESLKQRKKASKRLKKFNETLEVMNYLFHNLKNASSVTPAIINAMSPVKLEDDVVDLMVRDINAYEDKS